MNKKLLFITLMLFIILSTGCININSVSTVIPEKSEFEEISTPEPIHITVLSMKSKIGDVVEFGLYEQDNISSNGREKILWRVLSVENSDAILISEYGLDALPYHDKKFTYITWEECSLRSWLNNSFYDNSFNEKEKSKILLKTLSNRNNPEFGTIGGNPTKDKVYILSIDEATKYFPSDKNLRTTPTIYAKSKNADVSPRGVCEWWLRSPGFEGELAATAAIDIFTSGYVVSDDDITVRPVICVKLDP